MKLTLAAFPYKLIHNEILKLIVFISSFMLLRQNQHVTRKNVFIIWA